MGRKKKSCENCSSVKTGPEPTPGDPVEAHELLSQLLDILEDGPEGLETDEGQIALSLAREYVAGHSPGNVFDKARIGLLRLAEAAKGSGELEDAVREICKEWEPCARQFYLLARTLNMVRMMTDPGPALYLRQYVDLMAEQKFQQHYSMLEAWQDHKARLENG